MSWLRDFVLRLAQGQESGVRGSGVGGGFGVWVYCFRSASGFNVIGVNELD
jgi:hypothetical protein